jgi:FKBP-type peptidyl-prolyl cis-trans isomerase
MVGRAFVTLCCALAVGSCSRRAGPPSSLKIEDVSTGSGREVRSGDTIYVRYTGTLLNGTEFASTEEQGGRPFKVIIGKHDVIRGFEDGVVGMKVGGRRKLRVPPELGYGPTGSSIEVPPNSTLLFDVELVSIDSGAKGDGG